MKASPEQIVRIRELARKTNFDMRSLRRFTGQSLSEMDKAMAGEVLRILNQLDVRPLPADPDEAASRFAAAWPGEALPAADHPLPTDPTRIGFEYRPPTADESALDYAKAILRIDAATTRCRHCGGYGVLRKDPPKNEVYAAVICAEGTGSISLTRVIQTLRNPSFPTLSAMARRFNGPFDDAVAFNSNLADLFEREKAP